MSSKWALPHVRGAPNSQGRGPKNPVCYSRGWLPGFHAALNWLLAPAGKYGCPALPWPCTPHRLPRSALRVIVAAPWCFATATIQHLHGANRLLSWAAVR